MSLDTVTKKTQTISLIGLLFSILFGVSFVSAQSGQGIDASYNPLLAGSSSTSSNSGDSTFQPDGKILIYRGFEYVNGLQRTSMARLNPDGTLDTSFNCTFCSTFSITSAVVQPDGKILIAGFYQAPSGLGTAARRYRLNADGSLDTSFNASNPEPSFPLMQSANVVAATADGKSYGTTESSAPPSLNSLQLVRYNADGSVDSTFTALVFNLRLSERLGHLVLLPDGKLMIGGNHSFGFLFRVNSNGTKDTTFESPNLTYTFQTQIAPRVSSFDIQTDGKIVFVGAFTTVNGALRSSFARLNADGSLDLTFNPNPPFPGFTQRIIDRIALQPSGKMIVYAPFDNNRYFVRFNADGTVDNTFSTTQGTTKWQLDNLGRIFMYGALSTGGSGYLRLTQDGAVDPSFNTPDLGAVAGVTAIAVQSDGKAVISGSFTQIGGGTYNRLARLNADGTPDSSFTVGSGPNAVPTVVAAQADGKIIAGGAISSFNGTATGRLIRINSNGTLDAAFAPVFNGNVLAAAIQADGKILVGGSFTTVNGQPRNALVRLNADGTLDSSFMITLESAVVNSVVVQPDSKIAVGGSFSGINGFARANAARLNADGTVDTSFNIGTINPVYSLLRQANGKYVVMTVNQIFRRNADGTADNTFQTAVFASPTTSTPLAKIAVRADGTVIAGGTFETVNGTQRRNIARLKSDGTLDLLFVQSGANGAVLALAEQADGKILAGGSFTNIGGVTRIGLARILNIPVLRAGRFDFDGDGRTDFSVFRPANGTWYQLTGANYTFSASEFGTSTDIVTPADYDGDGKTDLAVYRNGNWYILGSTSGFSSVTFGQSGDVPVPADLDGDGRAELVVFRPSTNIWYSFNRVNNQASSAVFGNPNDRPVIGDYDGDGKSDIAVYRPTTGQWFYAASSQNGAAVLAATWGLAADKAVPADYDGDGKADAAIFRDGIWAIKNSGNASETILQWGTSGDLAAPGDYDGDGRADVAVFRPSSGAWYVYGSTSGFQAATFGANGDRPVPNAYVR